MSVEILTPNGAEPPSYDSDKEKFAYFIWPSGALTVLVNQGTGWVREREYSPSGWKQVFGTIYSVDPTPLPGLHGRAGEVEPSVQIF